jgi:hypothetical protein
VLVKRIRELFGQELLDLEMLEFAGTLSATM